jgi:cobalt-zinc-cadmium efflux system membrane fusion protein
MIMSRSLAIFKVFFRVLLVLLVLGGVAGGSFLWVKYRPANAAATPSVNTNLPHIDWDYRYPDIIRLPADYSTALKVQTATVRPAPPPEPLRLRGSLMLDANRLARIKCFFAGRIVSFGKADAQPHRIGPPLPADLLGKKTNDPDTLRPGDFVRKDQLLAVVWSKDLGTMKSQLVDAISHLEVDQKLFDRYVKVDKGVIAQKDYDNARRNVEADLIQVALAERTLRSYHLTEEEIAAVRREAEKLSRKNAKEIAARSQPSKERPDHVAVDPEVERTWAETTIRAPIDGVIVEKNVTIGDVIDNTTDLFKIVDLRYLQVMVNAYEEDIAALRRLKPEQRRWKIHFDGAGAGKPLEGEIAQISPIIDPTQHTGLVTGWMPNPGGDRLIGEFVTATVDLPADPSLVAVLASALIEEGGTASVLVAVNGSPREFTPRQVAVVQRGRETVLIRAEPNAAEKRRGAQPLHAGEEVVTTGNLQLAAELANFKASPAGRQ